MAFKENLFSAVLGASVVVGALYIIGILDHHDEPVVVDNPSLRIDFGGKAEISQMASNKYRRKSTTPLDQIVAKIWTDIAKPPQEVTIQMARARIVDFVLEEYPVGGPPQKASLRFERTWVPLLDHADMSSSINFRQVDTHTIEPVSALPVHVSAVRVGDYFYCLKDSSATDEAKCLASNPPAKVKVCIFPRAEKPKPRVCD